jgi:hypothetical protein
MGGAGASPSLPPSCPCPTSHLSLFGSSPVGLVPAVLFGLAVTTLAVISVPPAIRIWGSAYVQLLSVAWVTQLIFGVV